MRYWIIVLILLNCGFSKAQEVLDTPISVKFNKLSLDKCLIKIEQVSDVDFSYNSKQLATNSKLITAEYNAKPLAIILTEIFHGTSFKFKVIGGQVTVFESVQNESTIVLSGYVRQQESKEEIPGARIYFPNLQLGCVTNAYGFYSVELPAGNHSCQVSSMGMKTQKNDLNIQESMILNFILEINSIELSTVSVNSIDSTDIEFIPDDLSNPEGTVLSGQKLTRLPSPSGVPDLLKVIQNIPGFQSSADGGANFQVRGTGSGNNLILLDEIPIYHPTHALGLYSIINTDAVKSAELYKDYIPAKFGMRNSSVVQIHTREGDLEKYHLHGGINLVNGRVNIEGPLVKNVSSFYTSARYSLFPNVANNLLSSQSFYSPRFYDINVKLNYHINSNNRIYLTGYWGKDRLSDTANIYKWGNLAGGLRWNHIVNSKTFSNFSLTHSEFNYGYSANGGYEEYEIGQKVSTDKATLVLSHFYSNNIRFDFGADFGWIRTGENNEITQNAGIFLERSAFEGALFGSTNIKISDRLQLNAGLRLPIYFHIGTQDTTNYMNSDLTETQVIYYKNKLYDLNFFLDPRILVTYKMNDHNKLLLSLNIASQNTHVVSYINYFLPIEIWTTSNSFLKPQRSFSESVGWIHLQEKYQISLTLFNRNVMNVIDYATPVYKSSQDIESNLLSGNLHAVGAEFQLNFVPNDRYEFSIGYSFIRARQRIDGINNDEPYVAANEKPHYVTFGQYFNLSKKWQFATNFIWHSGASATLPNGQFTIGETIFPLFPNARNAERLPYFARLDLSATRKLGIKKNRDRFQLIFTVTNALFRTNSSVVYVGEQFINSGNLILRSIDYTPFQFSISLNYKFL